MSDHEMINLDEMGSLKTSMESLQETLLNNHRICLLYTSFCLFSLDIFLPLFW